MPGERPSDPPRIWALLGARAGDNGQVLGLTKALGLPFEIKQLEYNALRLLGPRLLGSSLASLTRASRHVVTNEPPPDLTISVGHRSVPVVQSLRHRSGGQTRSVHIGFPRISPSHFDLVLTTPQYPVLDHGNVIRLPFALAGVAGDATNAGDDALLAALPSPRRLLIVGGPNIYWRLDQRALLGALSSMVEETKARGGSVIVTTSPRTPPRPKAMIAEALKLAGVPTLLAEPKQSPAYASLLTNADTIHVTADSVAMVSDAVWTGKPMTLVPVRKNWLGSAVMGLMDRMRPDRRVYPQDLRFFWRALEKLGITDRLSQPRAWGETQLREIAGRVSALVGQAAVSKEENGGRGKD